jgi:hypothetical protein
MADQAVNKDIAPSIDVKSLSYLFPDGSSGLKDVFLDLPPGSRTLLIGGEDHLPPHTGTQLTMHSQWRR